MIRIGAFPIRTKVYPKIVNIERIIDGIGREMETKTPKIPERHFHNVTTSSENLQKNK